MRTKQSNSKNRMRWLALVLILFLYVVVVLLGYSTSIRTQARIELENNIQSKTENLGKMIQAELKSVNHIGNVVSAIISSQRNINTRTVIHSIENNSYANRVYITTPEGMATDGNGNTYNITQAPYYIDTSHLETVVSKPFQDVRTQEYVITISVPIVKDETFKGSVVLFYFLDRFKNMPNFVEYFGRGAYGLVDSSGKVVCTAGTKGILIGDGADFYEIMKSVEYKKSTYDNLVENTKNEKNGYAICKTGNSSFYVVYNPIKGSGLYAVTIVDENYVKQMEMRIWKPTKDMAIKVILGLGVFFITIVIINVINKISYNKKHKELQKKADTDLLTELYNKVATEKGIKDYLAEIKQEDMAMLILLDIDNFKTINDTKGHAFGDEVLRVLGKKLKAEFRISDIIGRTGGDEFIIFLKDITDEDIIRKEAYKIEGFFKEFRVGEYVTYPVTASIGVATFPADGRNFEELYKAADEALYKSKSRGKNQLSFYNSSFEENSLL